jgi:hypothetical protein
MESPCHTLRGVVVEQIVNPLRVTRHTSHISDDAGRRERSLRRADLIEPLLTNARRFSA